MIVKQNKQSEIKRELTQITTTTTTTTTTIIIIIIIIIIITNTTAIMSFEQVHFFESDVRWVVGSIPHGGHIELFNIFAAGDMC